MPILARLQDAVTRSRPGFVSSAFWVGVGVAVPTLMRMGLDPLLGMTLWFPTYYPAALLCTLFRGWRSGVGLVLLSAIAANYFFVPPRYQLAGLERNLAGTLVFLVAAGIIVLAAALLRTALVRLQAAHERERILNTELQHRMKNTLAVVQGLVAQTVKGGAPDPKAFQAHPSGTARGAGSRPRPPVDRALGNLRARAIGGAHPGALPGSRRPSRGGAELHPPGGVLRAAGAGAA